MNVGLLEAKGAQPIKPSRYKPIWTDRFFTGLFTNRSPFRSPLSAYYADGWNLGRTDTLLQGANVEITPRLTIGRRPGNTAFTSWQAPNPPLGFYSFHESNGGISLFYDDANAVYNFSPSSSTSIYTKVSGAGQTNYQGVGTQLYFGDGKATKAYDANRGTVRDLGLAAPAVAPFLNSYAPVGSGASPVGVLFNGGEATTAVSTANYTQCSVECLVKTSPNTSSTIASFESSGSGTSATIFQRVWIDGGGSLNYSIFDTTTNAPITINSHTNIGDNQWHHIAVGYSFVPSVTMATSFYNGAAIAASAIASISSNPTSTISYSGSQSAGNVAAPATMQVYMWVDGVQVISAFPTIVPSTSNGFWRIAHAISSALYLSELSVWTTLPVGVDERWNTIRFGQTGAGSLEPNGIPTYEAQLVNDGNPAYGLQYWWKLADTSGTTAAAAYGSNPGTYTGSLITLNQTSPIEYLIWQASTTYQVNTNYIVDTNGNLQQGAISGATGLTQPVWNTNLGATTTDNAMVWRNLGPAGLKTTISHQWCYCYGDAYGNYSTASPLSTVIGTYTTGLQAVNVIAIPSADPNVTHVAYFRTVDGGSTFFYIGSRPSATSGNISYWDMFQDSYCNILMAAPLNHANDQPPQGLTALTYHMSRMWGAVGNTLYASGGPDTLVGNGNESFPPANSWTYPSQILKIIPHTSGLIVLTTSGIWTHAGGPAISQFYPQPLFERIGISNYNAADIRGNEITLFSTDRCAFTFDLSANSLNDIGYAIADQLKVFNPLTARVVYHRKGDDNALYICDGSTGWYRCVSQQPPDYSITGPVWSPKADIL